MLGPFPAKAITASERIVQNALAGLAEIGISPVQGNLQVLPHFS